MSVDRLLSQADDHGADPGMRFRLLRAAQVGLRSYNIGMEASLADLGLYLQSLAPELRGIAVEGITMALFFRDRLRPAQRLMRTFLGPYAPYTVFAHVGCGLMLARFRRPVSPYWGVFSDLSSSMVLSGYGFGRTVFGWKSRSFEVPEPPRGWSSAERRIFDHGVGRAMAVKLFGRMSVIEDAIRKMPSDRQRDVWQGVGSAIAYNVSQREASRVLLELACDSALPHLALGACMASWVRAEAGNRSEETDLAAVRLAGQDVERQLALVRAHAPAATSVLPEQWLAWWDKVGQAF
jgi:hypothetical protein